MNKDEHLNQPPVSSVSDLMTELHARRQAMNQICSAVGSDNPERVSECFRLMEAELFSLRKELKAFKKSVPCPNCSGTGWVKPIL